MGLEDIAALEKLGKVKEKNGRKAGDHVVEINVVQEQRSEALVIASAYFFERKDIQINSMNYDNKKGKLEVKYTDLEEASTKAKGPGCGSSMIPAYQPRQ